MLSMINARHITTIIILTLALVSVSIGLTLTQPFEYRSSFSLLIVEQNGSLDGFAAAKSAERLTTSLSQIMYTTSFYDQVLEKYEMSGKSDGDLLFSNSETERRKEWKRRVETHAMPEVGLLKISVYDRDRAHADQLASTLALVLVEHGAQYLSGGQSVSLRIVDSPLTSERPARPNIAYNAIIAVFVSMGLSIAWLAIRSLTNTPTPVPQMSMPQQPAMHVRVPEASVESATQPAPQNLPVEQANEPRNQDGNTPLGWHMP